MKKYVNIIMGSLLVAASYSFFLYPNNILSNGFLGASQLIYYELKINPVISLGLLNFVTILIFMYMRGFKKSKRYLLPSTLIPLFILIFNQLNTKISFTNIEPIIITICGATIAGYGYSFLAKEDYSVSGIQLFQKLINIYNEKVDNTLIIFFELFLVGMALVNFSFEQAIYSAISIVAISYLSKKSKIGISNSKTFFIITEKEKEVKKYIIEELHYDLTEFDVKGGYTNNKNKILMSVIDTKDYYAIKEGISVMDPNAFISIIDNYESINRNLALKHKRGE